VPQVRLDLDFTAELVFDACLGKLRLEKDLEGYNVVALLLARQVNVAELATPERLANVEIC